jgi:hypothetical protein
VADPIRDLEEIKGKLGKLPEEVARILAAARASGRRSPQGDPLLKRQSGKLTDPWAEDIVDRAFGKGKKKPKAPDLGMYGTLLDAVISPFFQKVAPLDVEPVEEEEDRSRRRRRPPKTPPLPSLTAAPSIPDPNDFGEGLGMPAASPTVPLAEEPFGGETSSTAILQAILEVLREILTELQSPTGESAGLREATPFQVRDQSDVKRLPHAIPLPAGNFNRGAGR